MQRVGISDHQDLFVTLVRTAKQTAYHWWSQVPVRSGGGGAAHIVAEANVCQTKTPFPPEFDLFSWIFMTGKCWDVG